MADRAQRALNRTFAAIGAWPRFSFPLCLSALAGLSSVQADPIDAVNAVRLTGCESLPAVTSQLHTVPELHIAARRLARERRLDPALEFVSYRAMSATSFHVSGSDDDAQIERLLTENFCSSLLDPRYVEAGYYQNNLDTWIVVAEPGPAPIRLEPKLTAELVLGLVNAARIEGRRCGDDDYPRAGPVTLSDRLSEAARLHAEELADRGELSHTGLDGSDPGTRVSRTGYEWYAAGENVAGGQRTADAVVEAWLQSPGHCATLMGQAFTQMGIAYVLVPEGNPEIYWAQVFAAPASQDPRGRRND